MGDQKTDKGEKDEKDKGLWRDLVAYWLLGLCTNFGYNVLLSAGHDILSQYDVKTKYASGEGNKDRNCNYYSVGIVLLADNAPCLIVKFILPFLPFFNIDLFVAIVIIGFSTGFSTVAFANSVGMALFGICICSASAGVASSSFLMSTVTHNKNVVSTFTSGIGAAGLVGTTYYASMAQIGFAFRTIILTMLTIPIVVGLVFWILLRRKENFADGVVKKPEQDVEDIAPKTIKEKLYYVRLTMRYFVPLFTIYIIQYVLNQGLFELFNFKKAFINKKEQYRWFSVDYRIGNFIARSSVNLVRFKNIWLMNLWQFINLVYCLFDVLFYFTPHIFIIFIIVMWEGLISGAASVNTYFNMAHEIPANQRRFSFGVVAQADAAGVLVASLLAINVHNLICSTPSNVRNEWTF